uniref:Apolipoprotein B48 receptor-like protein n=1 Tax=uncultured Verrucomicrobiota bacterium TaxID=156588 RepID=D2DXQ6_9BACT|nr:apolipoprotein B48 receptor-like protein [uncultured Verrucomicrobiota bacterium]
MKPGVSPRRTKTSLRQAQAESVTKAVAETHPFRMGIAPEEQALLFQSPPPDVNMPRTQANAAPAKRTAGRSSENAD